MNTHLHLTEAEKENAAAEVAKNIENRRLHRLQENAEFGRWYEEYLKLEEEED